MSSFPTFTYSSTTPTTLPRAAPPWTRLVMRHLKAKSTASCAANSAFAPPLRVLRVGPVALRRLLATATTLTPWKSSRVKIRESVRPAILLSGSLSLWVLKNWKSSGARAARTFELGLPLAKRVWQPNVSVVGTAKRRSICGKRRLIVRVKRFARKRRKTTSSRLGD